MQPLAQFQALVVGVGSYEYFTDLPETVNDATQLQRILTDPQRCGYAPDRVQTLVEPNATRGNILDGLAKLARRAAGDTTTVIYFSGHGGVSRSDLSQVYLCPTEANPANMADTAISNEVFSQALVEIKTQRLVVIIDACHAGGAASFKGVGERGIGAEKAAAWESGLSQHLAQFQLREGSGRVIFASSRREQSSWGYASGHMGLFTYYLIQGLMGRAPVSDDGTIRVFDLFDYVSKQVRVKKRGQEPVLAAKDVTLNFPFALAYGERGISAQVIPSTSQDEFLQLRDAIVQNASTGIRAFANYLRNVPLELLTAAGTELAVVELKLTQFNELEKNIRILGAKPEWTVDRHAIMLFFIQLCLDLQRILDV
jgi:caspase domain-containing protein